MILFLAILCVALLSLLCTLCVTERERQGGLVAFGFFSALVVGALLQTGSTILQAREQRKASRRAQEANRIRRQREAEQQARERTLAFARARREQAAQRQQAFNQGIAGSSVAAGTVGSTQTQLASAVGAQNVQAQLADQETAARQSAASAQSRAGTFQAIGSLGQIVTQNREIFR